MELIHEQLLSSTGGNNYILICLADEIINEIENEETNNTTEIDESNIPEITIDNVVNDDKISQNEDSISNNNEKITQSNISGSY